MAQNITLMGASYSDVPAVELPKTGGGISRFTDVTPTTATDSDVASGKVYFKADGSQSIGTASGGSATLITKNIMANGTYNAEDDNADGYSSVTVAVPGVKKLTGSFTVGSNDTSYTISFGETISKYLFLIEMTDASKTTLSGTGNTSPRSYAFTGMYPSPGISNNAPANCMTTYRIKASTGELSYSQATLNNATTSSITISSVTLSGGAQYLYRGYSYNYYIVEVT